jgi:hypothetical protein
VKYVGIGNIFSFCAHLLAGGSSATTGNQYAPAKQVMDSGAQDPEVGVDHFDMDVGPDNDGQAEENQLNEGFKGICS